MMLLALAAAFVPVAAVAEVKTTRGTHYRVETCFRAPDDLVTRFIYPDRTAVLTIAGGKVLVEQTGKPDEDGGDAENRFAFGHQFHAIALNAAQWAKEGAYALPYGGSMTVLATDRGRPSKLRFDSPDTTPVDLTFSDWRGDGHTPFRLELLHAGVTYDYRFTSVERRCDKPS